MVSIFIKESNQLAKLFKLLPDFIVKELNDLASEHIQSVLKTPSKYDEILPSYQSAYNEYNKK